MIKYSEDNIKSNNSINKLPEMTIGEQKSRKTHLQIYKKLNIPILTYPVGKKNPVVKGWNTADIKTLWKQQKEELKTSNLGMRLEDVLVIDIDDPVIAKEKLGDLQLPVTSIVYRGEREPGKVLQWEERGHIYSKRPSWLKFKNSKKLPDLGIELRTGAGSQNVIPDSIHPDGTRYKWHYSEFFFQNKLQEFPEDLFKEIINRANIFHEDETAELKIIAEEEATSEFFKWKKILDQLIQNYGLTCEKGEFTQGGQAISRGINYYGICPRADRHTKPSSSKEFLIHLSFTGAIKKHCHHTHCTDLYKEKLEELFKFTINDKAWYFLDEEEEETAEETEEKPAITSETVKGENYFALLKELRETIYKTRQAKKKKEVDKNETCFRGVCNFLEDNGSFIKDNNNICYYFDKNRKLTYQIYRKDPDYSIFLHCIGLAENEMIARIITKRLQKHCLLTGREVDIKKFCYFDRKNFTIYLDLRNKQNQILKITTSNMDIVDNGTDGIMFQRCQGSPIQVKVPLSENSGKFEEMILDRINFDTEETGLTVEEQQVLFELFFMALFFESIFPTKPLLLMYGVKGSGKSFSLRIMGKLLFGDEWNLSSVTSDNERDIKVASLHKSFLAIDNADSRIKWMNDFLAKMATGEQFEERQMRENFVYLSMKPSCFIGLTARTPKFRRDDIADRLLILSVKPLEDNFIPENDLLDELEEHRDILWSEIIFKLQIILRQLQQGQKQTFKTKFRMADFYSFACKIVGEEKVKDIFRKLQQEQYDFSLDEDPLYELLQIYIEDEETIEGEFLSGKDLFFKLSSLAEGHRIKFHYSNVLSLTAKLRHLWKGIQTKFDCQIKKDKNIMVYSFKRKSNTINTT
ncbi:MAG TPA: bifunctional DNA primase/polymerase [Candidatus Eremiobacteraeota bacterium]|nr:bifunctional DNA primase/polymerase [Candidatus Eremiobacteraeota bacterium]